MLFFDKVKVNGRDASPVYTYLKQASGDQRPIEWNFVKARPPGPQFRAARAAWREAPSHQELPPLDSPVCLPLSRFQRTQLSRMPFISPPLSQFLVGPDGRTVQRFPPTVLPSEVLDHALTMRVRVFLRRSARAGLRRRSTDTRVGAIRRAAAGHDVLLSPDASTAQMHAELNIDRMPDIPSDLSRREPGSPAGTSGGDNRPSSGGSIGGEPSALPVTRRWRRAVLPVVNTQLAGAVVLASAVLAIFLYPASAAANGPPNNGARRLPCPLSPRVTAAVPLPATAHLLH